MILIQARSTSRRFPNKHLAPLGDSTVLDTLISRVMNVMPFAFIVPEGDALAGALAARNIPCFEGPEYDVLNRYLRAMYHFELSWCIRVTGDCPLVSPQDLLWMANACVNLKADFGTNCRHGGTDGQEIEFISRRLMQKMDKDIPPDNRMEATNLDREHVTTWAKANWEMLEDYGFKMYEAPIQYGWHNAGKLSIDTPEDLARVEILMNGVKSKWP